MIDFTNKSFIKLNKINITEGKNISSEVLLLNEKCLLAFKSVRDYIIFTDRRIISINTQGVSGRKKDYTSMPYSKINVYSTETSGMADFDSELEVYFSGIGGVKFEFTSDTDITFICRLISAFIFGDEEERKLIINDFLLDNKQDINSCIPDIKAGPNEWKCPNCGKINQNYVGTCGCGQHK